MPAWRRLRKSRKSILRAAWLCGTRSLGSGLTSSPAGYTYQFVYQGTRHAGFEVGQQPRHPLPAAVVEALELKDGDEVEVHVAGERAFEVGRDRSRERALARIRALGKSLPADWRFDRGDANAR